ncbi:hypothetical protein PG985_010524 [Apiospora marii]|uniref:Uncharacterized protein n=1 Tax=Apiospora marii TaxID=335849 RepID=A0ABR1T168_9PEZI
MSSRSRQTLVGSSGGSSTETLVGHEEPTIFNTGFLYICGHRDDIYGETSKLYEALMHQGLVSDRPDMGRELETCCDSCWVITTSPTLMAKRAKVLDHETLDTTHAHSLLAMLYHLGNRLLEDPHPTLIALLTKWAQCVATRYITNETHQHQFHETHEDQFRAAILANIPPLVAEDAASSIKTFRAPMDWPGVSDTAVERDALATKFGRLRSRDHDLRWTLGNPWPAELAGFLFDLDHAAIRYAALFKTVPLDLVEFSQYFKSLAGREPQDYSLYVYHSKLVDAVRELKLAIYKLALFAAGEGSAVRSREELKEVMTMATLLKGACDNVHNLHGAFMGHLDYWMTL